MKESADEIAARSDASPISSLNRLLRPKSIAIIGASSKTGSLGDSVLRNLERAGFQGDLFLVNPKHPEIRGHACIASAADLPEGVDCAVLAIPRAGVREALAVCAQRKVCGAVIFSAGYAESGAAGRAEQDELARIAREHNMIVEGPNCLGFVNGVDAIPVTFVADSGKKLGSQRGIGVVSQSGAMAAVLGVSLRNCGLGISFSVSTGNEAVTGVEDYVEFLIENAETHAIAMIVESFRKPQKFLDLVRRARRRGKDIVLLHPGRGGAARASAATHTGAMTGDYAVMRTIVEHAGVIVSDTLEELIDVAQLVLCCPSWSGGGAAVLTDSGAFKALTMDFCESVGLPLPALSARTEELLRQALPEFIPPSNPLDITAQALVDPGLYLRTLRPLVADDRYASIVLTVILTDESTCALKFPSILDAVAEIGSRKPVIFAQMDEGATVPQSYRSQLRELGVPFFPSPERAFRALACLTRSASKRVDDPLVAPVQKQIHIDGPSPAELNLPRGVLSEYQSKGVLATLGVAVPRGGLAQTASQALVLARDIGYPVALKAQSAGLTHKSDAGGVVLNVSESDLVEAWDRMHVDIGRRFPSTVLDGVLVEKMAPKGIELIVGARRDPDWGPVLLVGFGGVLAEAVRDTRLLPPGLGKDAIVEELLRLNGAALLKGFRGSPALDIGAAAAVVMLLDKLMRRTSEVQEVEINPLLVLPEGRGALALDALIATRENH
jgi:acyl-CoA synthetase (NDP forming)